MAGLIQSEVLKAAARLTSRLAEIDRGARGDPWQGTYLISADRGRLRLVATDGTMRLEWSMPADGLDQDGWEEGVDAGRFNALASSLADGDRYEIARDGGLHLSRSGLSPSRSGVTTTRVRLPARACPPFPPRVLAVDRDGPAPTSSPRVVPAAALARALAFVAPFIRTGNPIGSRSVATWTPEGVLVGGSPRKGVLVGDLPPAPVPLSFRQWTALAAAAFLERVSGDVEVRAEGAYCSFTGIREGHVLELRGEPAPFPAHLLKLELTPRESWRIDRKAFLNSLEILEVLLPTRGANFEFRVGGDGENAAVRISTPGTPATCSNDRVAIYRDGTVLAALPGPPPDGSACSAEGPLFWARGRPLRRALNSMTAVSIHCLFDPVRRRICLREAPRPGGIVRSFYLEISTPEGDRSRKRRGAGPAQDAGADPGCGSSVASGEGHPPDADPADGRGSSASDFREVRPRETGPGIPGS